MSIHRMHAEYRALVARQLRIHQNAMGQWTPALHHSYAKIERKIRRLERMHTRLMSRGLI
jgi:hypothetical protein